MGKGKGSGSGRPKKEKEKRISGTGYTYAESRQLLYSRQAEDGTYEIDTNRITEIISDYTDEEKRTKTKKINIVNKKTGAVTSYDETYITPISRAGLRKALGIYNTETYNLWMDGYVNRDHRDNEGYKSNIKLSEAVCAGDTDVAVWLCEEEDSKHSSRTIRLLETMGELSPAGHSITAPGGWGGLGSLKKYAK